MARIPQPLHRAVLRVLRPAESAMRRLIVIAARGLVVKLAPSRPMPKGAIGKGGQSGNSRSSFQLFDPRKRFAELSPPRRKGKRAVPRISILNADGELVTLWEARPRAPEPPPPDGLVNGEPISRRLQALKAALEDLPRQAWRLARWRLRREAMQSPKFKSPLRPGRPSGYRRKAVHEVDEVHIECHGLACDAMRPDTS